MGVGGEGLHLTEGVGPPEHQGKPGQLTQDAAGLDPLQAVEVELPDLDGGGQPGVPAQRKEEKRAMIRITAVGRKVAKEGKTHLATEILASTAVITQGLPQTISLALIIKSQSLNVPRLPFN